MSKGREARDFWDLLLLAPWWVSFCLAVGVYAACRLYVPTIQLKTPFFVPLATALTQHAHFIAMPFLIVSAISFFRGERS